MVRYAEACCNGRGVVSAAAADQGKRKYLDCDWVTTAEEEIHSMLLTSHYKHKRSSEVNDEVLSSGCSSYSVLLVKLQAILCIEEAKGQIQLL